MKITFDTAKPLNAAKTQRIILKKNFAILRLPVGRQGTFAPWRCKLSFPNYFKMELIKEILPQVIDNLSSGKLEIQNKINNTWPKLLEAKLIKHAKPAGFKKGLLIINVDSPVWLFHLNFKRREILSALQKEFKELSSLKFRIGRIK